MKQNVWIFNHYAARMFANEAGRHYWFAENLVKHGYKVTVFCAATVHGSDQVIDTGDKKYLLDSSKEIPFVFVKAPTYADNGKERTKNMFAFYRNLFPVAAEYAQYGGAPDIILASSVHPLTLVAGIKIAKKFGVPCICEVRDLWPESIVVYGYLDRKSLMAKILYQGEKWIYKKADSVIMTWEGGKDYISDNGWDKQIDMTKIKHINNGVVIDSFDRNIIENPWIDPDLENEGYKNIVYAGSIRRVNHIGLLLDSAKIIQQQGIEEIKFLIFGEGPELEPLQKRCIEENITNVIFKGRVDKRCVPSIVNKAYINVLHNESTSLDKYGQSQNKLFEYLAAGRCILQTYKAGYGICERYDCGVIVPQQNAEEIARSIIAICSDEARCQRLGENARKAAYDFDFGRLTDQLVDIIESV